MAIKLKREKTKAQTYKRCLDCGRLFDVLFYPAHAKKEVLRMLRTRR